MDTGIEEQARERARKRVRELRDFFGHLLIYVFVNTILVIVDIADGSAGGDTFIGLNWAYWPIIGWGLFVMVHALQVFVLGGRAADRYEQRKVDEYLERERQRRLEGH